MRDRIAGVAPAARLRCSGRPGTRKSRAVRLIPAAGFAARTRRSTEPVRRLIPADGALCARRALRWSPRAPPAGAFV